MGREELKSNPAKDLRETLWMRRFIIMTLKFSQFSDKLSVLLNKRLGAKYFSIKDCNQKAKVVFRPSIWFFFFFAANNHFEVFTFWGNKCIFLELKLLRYIITTFQVIAMSVGGFKWNKVKSAHLKWKL